MLQQVDWWYIFRVLASRFSKHHKADCLTHPITAVPSEFAIQAEIGSSNNPRQCFSQQYWVISTTLLPVAGQFVICASIEIPLGLARYFLPPEQPLRGLTRWSFYQSSRVRCGCGQRGIWGYKKTLVVPDEVDVVAVDCALLSHYPRVISTPESGNS